MISTAIKSPKYSIQFVFGSMVLLISSACGGGGSATPANLAPPLISAFKAKDESIPRGTNTELIAEFLGGKGSVNHGIGDVEDNVPKKVIPAEDTTYTLTVTNAAGVQIERTLTVKVIPPKIMIPGFVTAGQAGYTASVTSVPGCIYSWNITNGILTSGTSGFSITFTAGSTEKISAICRVIYPFAIPDDVV